MKKALTTKKGEVRELTKKDFKMMRPVKEILPELANVLPKRKRGERGPQKEPKKISVTVRYSPEVVKYFKNSGAGWQIRMDEILKKYIKGHQKPTKKASKHSNRKTA